MTNTTNYVTDMTDPTVTSECYHHHTTAGMEHQDHHDHHDKRHSHVGSSTRKDDYTNTVTTSAAELCDSTMARHDDVHTVTNVHTSSTSTVLWQPQCQRTM